MNPGRIPQGFIDDLLARTDLVALVAERVTLKKAGRDFTGRCPFHEERTPSFTVSPSKQFYHCFGCGAHGSAIGFLMAYDRSSFPEAVEALATRLGLEMPDHAASDADPLRSAALSLTEEVAGVYEAALAASDPARRYLDERGILPETARRFRLGYAPAGSPLLTRWRNDGERVKLLKLLGLVSERTDRFHDRLMFPIRNLRGEVIGFGGRTLVQETPKYLNSPESLLFHKGWELYGWYEARQSPGRPDRLILVEGYLDAMALSQAGFPETVATLGTSLTTDQLQKMIRYIPEVIFCFDGDAAGRRASYRALELVLPLARAGRHFRFVGLPANQDPDSFVRGAGAEDFRVRLERGHRLSESVRDALEKRFPGKEVETRASLAGEAQRLLQLIEDPVYRELLREELAGHFKLGQVLLRPAAPTRPARATPKPGSRVPVGRGGIVRQLFLHLLHQPDLITLLPPESELDEIGLPGLEHIKNLQSAARIHENLTTGRLLELFRDSPTGDLMERLFGQAPLLDAQANRTETLGLIAKIRSQATTQKRLQTLLDLSRTRPLSSEEKKEFQLLESNLKSS
jgi:DNA primase